METLAGLYVDDADQHGDKHIDYAKGKRDELMRRIVGEDNFVEFDKAYGEAYMDELKRIRVKQEERERIATPVTRSLVRNDNGGEI